MNELSPFAERIQSAFRPGDRGVIGIVDELLKVCEEPGLRLDWRNGQCCVHSLANRPEESAAIPVSKSVLRAILARVAALCNERIPNSVSAYGGKAVLSVQADATRVIRLTFANTSAEHRLEIVNIRACDKEGKEFGVPSRAVIAADDAEAQPGCADGARGA